jgi:hypothetical protein
MVDAPPQTVDPFVDLVNRPNGRFALVGYRAAGLDQTLTSVELPILTKITPAGEIVSNIFGSSNDALSCPPSVATIDYLVSQAVSPNNLRLEEASSKELDALLRSLELAVQHVRAALMHERAAV